MEKINPEKFVMLKALFQCSMCLSTMSFGIAEHWVIVALCGILGFIATVKELMFYRPIIELG